jgi:hypothetical protein
MPTSLTQMRQESISDLGGGPDGYVVVELTDTQFDNIIKEAKRWFTARKGFVIWRYVPVIEGQLEYHMHNDVAQVLDVIFSVPTDVAAFFTLGFFDVIPYGPNTLLSMGSGLTNYSGFAQLLQFTEQRKRVFSVEPEWYYEQQTRLLHITARGGTPTGNMLVQLKLTDFDPSHLMDKDEEFFIRWVKCKVKEVVGRSRSKYDSLPAAGGPVTLDGRTLIDEAKEEMEKLNQELFWAQGPDGGILG